MRKWDGSPLDCLGLQGTVRQMPVQGTGGGPASARLRVPGPHPRACGSISPDVWPHPPPRPPSRACGPSSSPSPAPCRAWLTSGAPGKTVGLSVAPRGFAVWGWGQRLLAKPRLPSSLPAGTSGTSGPARAGRTPRGSGKSGHLRSAQAVVRPPSGGGCWGRPWKMGEGEGWASGWPVGRRLLGAIWLGLLEPRSFWMEPGPQRDTG